MKRQHLSILIFAALFPTLGTQTTLAQCVPLDSDFGRTHTNAISLYYEGGSSGALVDAAQMWNDKCDGAVPYFGLGALEFPSIPVNVHLSPGAPSDCPDDCGCAFPNLDAQGRLVGGVVQVGGNCSNPTQTIAHELGHILGLSDTYSSQCTDSIMYGNEVGAGVSVADSDCAAIDNLWRTEWETSDPCDDPVPQAPNCGSQGGGGSPILVDFDRDRFRLVGLEDFVDFDIDGDRYQERLSWTRGDTLDAFLVLDRNGNSVVDSGQELFGNYTLLMDGSVAEHGNSSTGQGGAAPRRAAYRRVPQILEIGEATDPLRHLAAC